MAENNLALIVVGIVAIVGIVGLLNFSSATGKIVTTGTNVVQSASEKELYTTQWECEEGGHTCSSFMAETSDPGVATEKFWTCGDGKLCHNLFYRIS